MENGISQDITRQQAAVPRPREAEIVERITFLCWLRPRVFAKHMEIAACNIAEAVSYCTWMSSATCAMEIQTPDGPVSQGSH